MNSKQIIRLLIIGNFVSTFGNFFSMIALNILVYQLSNSSIMVGMCIILKLLGGFWAGLKGGEWADRFDRRMIMIISTLICGIIALCIILIPQNLLLYYLLVISLVNGAGLGMFNIALHSSIPVIVGKENIFKTNSMFTLFGSVVVVLGTLSGALLISIIGYKEAFVVDSLTYFVLAIILLAKPFNGNEQTQKDHSNSKIKILDTVKALRLYPVLYAFFFIRILDTFGSGSHNLGFPIFSESIMPDNPTFLYGLIISFWGIGSLLGVLIMNKFNIWRFITKEMLYFFATILMSLAMILLFLVKDINLILLFAFLSGVGDSCSVTCYRTYLQKTEDHIRGRVMGISQIVQTSGFAMGMLVASLIAEYISVSYIVLIMHGIAIAAAVCLFERFKGLAEKNQELSIREV